ncbi:hypothetical protein N0V90_011797 [Kalmusia sp. IMI 367209]|nr:hypothetical protein N0V90_011797 [Kalmusia sp. IMI 367209]
MSNKRVIGHEEGPIHSEGNRRKADSESDSMALTHDAYTVGWVCALPKEQTAATAMLDQRHTNLPMPPNDHNSYTLGAIGKHNVVIACLPKGKIGTSSAATVATRMVNTFPSIKVGLMVGIGGGVSAKVRLGDVVISTPDDKYPGVVQWDFGKAEHEGTFRRTGALNNPPSALLTAITTLETKHEMEEPRIPEYLDELKKKWPKLVPKYLKSDSLEDVRFKADYGHVSESSLATADDEEGEDGEENCRLCDKSKVVPREQKEMCVHYGLIASGNQVIKDAAVRDRLNKDLGGRVLCVEMEAAGLMDDFPGIVIRGICDYADSHKNKDWQEHAAAVAAAFAKELLSYVQPSDVEGERAVKDVLIVNIGTNVAQIKSKMDGDEDQKIINWLTPVDYGPQQSDFLRRRHKKTGTWLLQTNEFETWLNQENTTLFCSGIPGAGKTILTSIVADYLFTKFQADPNVGIACLYINFRQQQQQRPEDLLLSILKQWLQKWTIVPEYIKKLYKSHERKRTRPSLDEITRALKTVADVFGRAIIIVDALDEYDDDQDSSRQIFLTEFLNLQTSTRANLFVTSRINREIAKYFDTAISLEIRADKDDVKSYVDGQMSFLPSDILDDDLRERIREEVVKSVDGMFLLAQLHMDDLKGQLTKGGIKETLRRLVKRTDRLYTTYERTMERIANQKEDFRDMAKRVLGWIVHATRTTFQASSAFNLYAPD